MNAKQKKMLIRIICAAVIVAAVMIGEHFKDIPAPALLVFCLSAYLITGFETVKKAFKGIKNRQPFDECFLMVVASLGAFVLGEYVEGAAVMLFYQIGELFEGYAVGKSRRNISELMDIRPDYANLVRDSGDIEKVDPDEVEIGSIIIVKPGEKIPIDGIITEGKTMLDTVALTGESVPRSAEVGDEVLSGCINESGLIKIRTTKEFGESTVSKILDLVENASSRKSRSENFISKFARVYTPAVCYSALALAVIPPLVRGAVGLSMMWGDWVSRALTFLVISCPCALVISIPLTFFAGIGGAGNAGILIKGSNFMETMSKVRYVLFDKTGTMTKGVFEVTGIHHNTLEKDEFLEIAAMAESFSTHPIAVSIRKAYGKDIAKDSVTSVEEISGKGVIAETVKGTAAAGNIKLMESLGINCEECGSAGTVVYIALNNEYAGHILISDVLKPDAAEAVAALKAAGIKKTVMLTGDRANAAESVAAEIGADEVFSELTPDGKVDIVEKVINESDENDKVAFVGDGINDAPVLSRADVGIAMGAMGSDAAIEAADIVLMDDDPIKISKAIRISRKCMRIVYENIVFAIGIKFIFLILGALGIANMWGAIFADVGVMIIAILNAVRALNVKRL